MENFNVCVCDMGRILTSCHRHRRRRPERHRSLFAIRRRNLNKTCGQRISSVDPTAQWHRRVDGHQMWIDLKHGGFVLSFRRKKMFPGGRKNFFRRIRGAWGRPATANCTTHSPAYMIMHFGSTTEEFFSELNIKYKTILHNASENKKKKSSNKPQEKSKSPQLSRFLS